MHEQETFDKWWENNLSPDFKRDIEAGWGLTKEAIAQKLPHRFWSRLNNDVNVDIKSFEPDLETMTWKYLLVIHNVKSSIYHAEVMELPIPETYLKYKVEGK